MRDSIKYSKVLNETEFNCFIAARVDIVNLLMDRMTKCIWDLTNMGDKNGTNDCNNISDIEHNCFDIFEHISFHSSCAACGFDIDVIPDISGQLLRVCTEIVLRKKLLGGEWYGAEIASELQKCIKNDDKLPAYFYCPECNALNYMGSGNPLPEFWITGAE